MRAVQGDTENALLLVLGVNLARAKSLLPPNWKVKKPEEGRCWFSQTRPSAESSSCLTEDCGPLGALAGCGLTTRCLHNQDASHVYRQKQLSSLGVAGTTEDSCTAPTPQPPRMLHRPDCTRALPRSWVPARSQHVSVNQKGKWF